MGHQWLSKDAVATWTAVRIHWCARLHWRHCRFVSWMQHFKFHWDILLLCLENVQICSLVSTSLVLGIHICDSRPGVMVSFVVVFGYFALEVCAFMVHPNNRPYTKWTHPVGIYDHINAHILHLEPIREMFCYVGMVLWRSLCPRPVDMVVLLNTSSHVCFGLGILCWLHNSTLPFYVNYTFFMFWLISQNKVYAT